MKPRAAFGFLLLFLAITVTNTSVADVIIDDFNTNRTYAPCCGEYGTYDSLTNGVAQSGSGTVTLSGNDNGGMYRDGFGATLWNLSGPTNLILRLRSLQTMPPPICW